jgi:hypothetical protein
MYLKLDKFSYFRNLKKYNIYDKRANLPIFIFFDDIFWKHINISLVIFLFENFNSKKKKIEIKEEPVCIVIAGKK